MGLSNDDKLRAQQEEQRRNATQDYLGGIEDPLAQGKGGYNADELSQIQLTPEQQQQMVTGAGISAGVGNAAAVGAAERAANAAGGNPAALATYRARAAQSQQANAGDAMTQARIAASNTAAQRAQAIGSARMGQQGQALNYYGGVQNQQNQNAQNAYGLQQQASMQPGIFDKVLGAASGAIGGLSKLADGDVGTGGQPAVVGEAGPEKVVQMGGGADYMGDGGMGDIDLTPAGGFDLYPEQSAAESAPPAAPASTSWLQRLRTMNSGQPQGAPAQQQPWSKVTPYQQLGEGVGKLASTFLADGAAPQVDGGIFTRPTEVSLDKNEAVVPLSYRAGAKVRPSMAALPAAKPRQSYRGYGG